MVIHWRLCDSKSPQVSRTLFSNLTHLSNALFYYFTILRSFHTNVCWWSFTEVCVTATTLNSTGLFSVFWSILIMSSSLWSPLSNFQTFQSLYPQFSRTLLSILAVLNNVVVWMVSTRQPNSKSYSPFNNPLVTVPKAPITIDIIVTYMFHSFFQFSSKVEVFILLFIFFQFHFVVSRDS